MSLHGRPGSVFHELNVVKKEIEIEAPAARVFDAWAEPDHLERWFTDRVTGWPGVGSHLNLTWKNFGFSVPYKIAVMKPPEKLVLKTRLSGVGTQVLTVNLARRAPKTIVSVSESGPENHKSDPLESGVDSGWSMALGVVKLYIERYFGKPRTTFFAMLPAQFQYDQLRPLYNTEEGLKRWLTVGGAPPGQAGEPYRFQLDDEQTMSGHVLAHTHHELALSWDEIDGYLELKSFPTGGENKGLCLRGSTYRPSEHSSEDLEKYVKDLLVRLFAALSS